MSLFVKATWPMPPRTKLSGYVAYVFAAILVVLSLCQLYTFDEFLELFVSFNIPGGASRACFTAGLIVVSEVFALPFLLGMKLSPLMRAFSMFLGWEVAAIWLKTTTWLVLSGSSVGNVGYLGTLVDLAPNWLTVAISLILITLSIWSSWGLWPGKRK